MPIIIEFLSHTPAWVYLLFAYLVWRGLQARRDRSAVFWTSTIVPGLLMLWALWGLENLYGLAAEPVVLWLVGLAAGAALGWRIAQRLGVVAGRGRGVLHLPADRMLLPLLLVTFAVRYAFGAAGAIRPELAELAAFRIADLLLSGVLTGVFTGKLAFYATALRDAPQVRFGPD